MMVNCLKMSKNKLILIAFVLLSLKGVAQETKVNKFKKLSGPEKCWVLLHPFVANKALKLSEEARKVTKEVQKQEVLTDYFNGNGDQLDAFRHTYWMARLTQEIGWRRAGSLGKAHEKGNYKDFKKQRLEEGKLPDKASNDMDLFNNTIGIEVGKKSSKLDLKELIVELVKEGKCKIIKVDSKYNYLDCEGKVIPKDSLIGKWENDKCLMWSNEVNK